MKEISVLVIHPAMGGVERRRVELESGTFQSLVGGWIEGLTLTDRISAYINEEGKFEELPVNPVADAFTRICLGQTGRGLVPGDYIVGPMVVCGAPDAEGWDTDVPELALELLARMGIEVVDAETP